MDNEDINKFRTNGCYWVVTHRAFSTDNIVISSTIVKAYSENGAKLIFNDFASKHRDYPYMYSDAISVSPMQFLG